MPTVKIHKLDERGPVPQRPARYAYYIGDRIVCTFYCLAMWPPQYVGMDPHGNLVISRVWHERMWEQFPSDHGEQKREMREHILDYFQQQLGVYPPAAAPSPSRGDLERRAQKRREREEAEGQAAEDAALPLPVIGDDGEVDGNRAA